MPNSWTAQNDNTLRACSRRGCLPGIVTSERDISNSSATFLPTPSKVYPSAFSRYFRSISSDAKSRTVSTKSLSPRMRSSLLKWTFSRRKAFNSCQPPTLRTSPPPVSPGLRPFPRSHGPPWECRPCDRSLPVCVPTLEHGNEKILTLFPCVENIPRILSTSCQPLLTVPIIRL